MSKLNQTSLVIATVNEEESIDFVLNEIKHYDFLEIIIVDNNSFDKTCEIATKYSTKVVQQSESGWGNAVLQGFNLAKGKYITYMDGDGSYNPKAIKDMLNLIDEYDFLCASRYKHNTKSPDDTALRAFGNKMFTFICTKFLKLNLTDSLFFYPLVKKEDYEKISPKSSNFGICIEIPLLLARNNLKYTDLLSEERVRFGGKTKVNALVDGFKIFLEIYKMY